MDKKHVNTLLDNLISLDQQTTRAYYEMGQLLYSFSSDKLYKICGYDNMRELVEEELSYSHGTANSYISLYANFKRLKYTKAEALKLLSEHGYSHLQKVLPRVKQKVGTRAIATHIARLDLHQINFTLSSAELEEVHKALTALGAVVSKAGRYKNSTEAFMEMVRATKGIRRAA